MSSIGAAPADDGSKKRKRTGKDRKQAKIEAEQAQARMAAIIAAANEEVPAKAAEAKLEPVTHTKQDARNTPATAQAAENQGVVDEAAQVNAAKKEPEQIAKRIPQALKALHPLLKQAKTQETQRLIKKIKWSRGKGEDVSDLESQVSRLSHLHLAEIAISHLRTKIGKHHQFKHQPLPTSIESALSKPAQSGVSSLDSVQGTETVAPAASTSTDAAQRAKVENRLVSNKVVADGIKGIMAWTMGEEGAKLQHRNQTTSVKGPSKIRQVAADKTSGKAVGVVGEGDVSDAGYGPVQGDEVEDGDASGSDSGVDEEERAAADAAGWESGSVDDLGDSDEEDGDSEDGDDDSSPDIPASSIRPVVAKRAKIDSSPAQQRLAVTKPSGAAATISTGPSPTTSKIQRKTDKPPKAVKAPKTAAVTRENITSSLFLPSLASGFTRGDSDDSDPDLDYDMDGAGVIGRKGAGGERKNRRGQRARQAIWEKKYGKNAKHVVRNREAENAAVKENNIRNAYGKRAGPPTAAQMPARTSSSNAARPAATIAPAPAPASAASKGPSLHPSWEAARKKKQLLAAAPAPKKIVFD